MVAARPPLRFPHDRPLPEQDRSYCLARCEGFRVDAPEGRLGVVSELRFGRRLEIPDLIGVRAGHIRSRLMLIPVDAVEAIDAAAGVLHVSAAPSSSRWSRLADGVRRRRHSLPARAA